MRKRFTTILFLGLCLTLLAPIRAFADIVINETNFPDAKFCAYLLEQDYGSDGVITDEEIMQITEISLIKTSVVSLEGIQYFTALKKLSCTDCLLETLEISGNTTLVELHCVGTDLTKLDVSGCTALSTLYCWDNHKLAYLDVSGCISLKNLSCNAGKLTTLDVSGCTLLEELACWANRLTMLNVSNCLSLKEISCYQNQLKGINMDKFIETLPVVSGHNIYMISKYDEDNICAKAQVAAMKEKGWLPYYSNGVEWLEYEGGYDTTGIDSAEVGNGDEIDANAPAYDLNANRVEGWQNRKGVYIVGGKKIVVK